MFDWTNFLRRAFSYAAVLLFLGWILAKLAGWDFSDQVWPYLWWALVASLAVAFWETFRAGRPATTAAAETAAAATKMGFFGGIFRSLFLIVIAPVLILVLTVQAMLTGGPVTAFAWLYYGQWLLVIALGVVVFALLFVVYSDRLIKWAIRLEILMLLISTGVIAGNYWWGRAIRDYAGHYRVTIANGEMFVNGRSLPAPRPGNWEVTISGKNRGQSSVGQKFLGFTYRTKNVSTLYVPPQGRHTTRVTITLPADTLKLNMGQVYVLAIKGRDTVNVPITVDEAYASEDFTEGVFGKLVGKGVGKLDKKKELPSLAEIGIGGGILTGAMQVPAEVDTTWSFLFQVAYGSKWTHHLGEYKIELRDPRSAPAEMTVSIIVNAVRKVASDAIPESLKQKGQGYWADAAQKVGLKNAKVGFTYLGSPNPYLAAFPPNPSTSDTLKVVAGKRWAILYKGAAPDSVLLVFLNAGGIRATIRFEKKDLSPSGDMIYSEPKTWFGSVGILVYGDPRDVYVLTVKYY